MLQGYQFLTATQQSYWLHWDTLVPVTPDGFSLHKMDLMNATAGWLYLVSKWPQVMFKDAHLHALPALQRGMPAVSYAHDNVSTWPILLSLLQP